MSSFLFFLMGLYVYLSGLDPSYNLQVGLHHKSMLPKLYGQIRPTIWTVWSSGLPLSVCHSDDESSKVLMCSALNGNGWCIWPGSIIHHKHVLHHVAAQIVILIVDKISPAIWTVWIAILMSLVWRCLNHQSYSVGLSMDLDRWIQLGSS